MPILLTALAFAVILLVWHPASEEAIEGRRGILFMLGLLLAGLVVARILVAVGRPAFHEDGVFVAALLVVLLGYMAIAFPPWILMRPGGPLTAVPSARMGLRVLYVASAIGAAAYALGRHGRVVAALEQCASRDAVTRLAGQSALADATIPDEELRPPAGRFQNEQPAYTCRQLRGE
jgi:hypothetical protein